MINLDLIFHFVIKKRCSRIQGVKLQYQHSRCVPELFAPINLVDIKFLLSIELVAIIFVHKITLASQPPTQNIGHTTALTPQSPSLITLLKLPRGICRGYNYTYQCMITFI